MFGGILLTNISYGWEEGGILDDFSFICAICGFKQDTHTTYDLEYPKTLKCRKCGAKYKVRRNTWLEKVDE